MQSPHILIVEDEAIVAQELQERLVGMGYRVCDPVLTGEEAIVRAEQEALDLVLMDIQLAGAMDGLSAAAELRRRHQTPVIFLTAYADEETLKRARASEPYGYVVKPFEARALRSTIEMGLTRSRLERQLKQNERWLATTLSSMGDALVATDSTGCVAFMNPAAEELTEWSQQDAVGRPFGEVVVIEADGTGQAPSSHLPVGAEPRMLVAPSGRRTPVDMTVTPLKNDGTFVGGEVVVLRDVTARMQAEATRTRLTGILEATPDLVATTDASGHAHYINRAGLALLGVENGAGALDLTAARPEWARRRFLEDAVPVALRDGVWRGESALTGPGREVPVSEAVVAHTNSKGVVEYLSIIARDISDRKRFEARLVHLADHDPLTDLIGRRRFREEVEHQLAYGVRYGVQGAVLFMDLDGLKSVNDTLGHSAGDRLLIQIAAQLRRKVRKTDKLARLGGDEFAVLLPNCTLDEASMVSENLLETVRGHTLLLDGRRINVTASVGIALFPGHGATVEELLAHADLAMYEAKGSGKDRACVYSPEQDWTGCIEERARWESQVRRAVRERRLVLYGQPIYDLHNQRVNQYELLLRMIDDDGRIVLPGKFLGVAERMGLIQEIDRWVAEQAIAVLASRSRDGSRVCLAMNVSSRAFGDTLLLKMLTSAFQSGVVQPGDLVLEILETAAINDIEQAQHFIEALSRVGCGFSLDDFGAGYSSLQRLKHLPVDYLKIDGSFVRDVAHNPVDQHLVRSIVEVARGLKKRTIAEFVENESTKKLLEEYGVDCVQGYHIGRPQPLSELLPPNGAVKSRAG